MTATQSWAATAPESGLAPLTIDRRALRDEDVAIDIAFCGVCHSDLHAARNDWGRTTYPFVPGHEIVGTVREVGAGVTKFRPGDRVAIGTVVDSCRKCDACEDDGANGDTVARLELGHPRTNLAHRADDFMAGDERIGSAPPIVARGVEVGMAHAAKRDVNRHVLVAQGAAVDGQRGESRFGRGGGP